VSGRWSGGAANRTWSRPGNRNRNVPGDAERGARLFELLKHERFWCDVCGGTHQLIEISACRAANPFMTALKGG
jgi:hypothetical protein